MADDLDSTTGFAPFKVGDETYQIWYKVVGKLGDGRRPIVCLHGGAGMSHHYMLPHSILAKRLNVPVVFYDQLGNGESTHLPDKPKDFWQSKLFVDQLDSLVKYLGISDGFDLIGNSWGGMLVAEYATRAPPGLKHLVISNSPASMALMKKGIEPLLEANPEQRDIIRKHGENGTLPSPEYQDAVAKLHKKYFCSIDPMPKELAESIAAVYTDPTVFSAICGTSIYDIDTHIVDWSIIDELHKIECPALVISSPHDVMQPCSIIPWFRNIRKVKWVELTNSTHMPVFEEPERYFNVLTEFLTHDEAA
ncbi:hypothetical protein ONZ45_g3514 [Pleurotus djamor]|nr:hypothetical protein ONZ45_g3514 [Pleurotus djamor]